jgi:hypothetical protein
MLVEYYFKFNTSMDTFKGESVLRNNNKKFSLVPCPIKLGTCGVCIKCGDDEYAGIEKLLRTISTHSYEMYKI